MRAVPSNIGGIDTESVRVRSAAGVESDRWEYAHSAMKKGSNPEQEKKSQQ
jgi:hypothetical protein